MKNMKKKPLIELAGGRLRFPDLLISEASARAKAAELLEAIPNAIRASVKFVRKINGDRSMDYGYSVQLYT